MCLTSGYFINDWESEIFFSSGNVVGKMWMECIMNTNYTTEGGNTLGEKCWEFTGQQRWVVCPVAFLGFSLASSSTVNAAGSPQVWGAQETGRQKKVGKR